MSRFVRNIVSPTLLRLWALSLVMIFAACDGGASGTATTAQDTTAGAASGAGWHCHLCGDAIGRAGALDTTLTTAVAWGDRCGLSLRGKMSHVCHFRSRTNRLRPPMCARWLTPLSTRAIA